MKTAMLLVVVLCAGCIDMPKRFFIESIEGTWMHDQTVVVGAKNVSAFAMQITAAGERMKMPRLKLSNTCGVVSANDIDGIALYLNNVSEPFATIATSEVEVNNLNSLTYTWADKDNVLPIILPYSDGEPLILFTVYVKVNISPEAKPGNCISFEVASDTDVTATGADSGAAIVVRGVRFKSGVITIIK